MSILVHGSGDPSLRLRCGIIGGGRIAWKYDGGAWDHKKSLTHSSCFDRHPATDLCAILEIDEQRRLQISSEHPIGKKLLVTGDLEQFLNSGLDVVSIASPSEFHAHHILKCIEAAIPYLWIEKPVTLDFESFEIIRSKLKTVASPCRNSVNFFRRFLPQYEFLRSKISDTQIVHLIEINYSRRLDVNGVHLLDVLGFLFPQEPPPPINLFTNFKNGNPSFGLKIAGIEVSVIGSDLPYHNIDIRVTTEEGRYSVNRGGLTVLEEKCVPNDTFLGFFHLANAVDLTDSFGNERDIDEGTYLSLCNLLDSSVNSTSTIETAYFSQAILEQVNNYFIGQ